MFTSDNNDEDVYKSTNKVIETFKEMEVKWTGEQQQVMLIKQCGKDEEVEEFSETRN